MYEQARQSVAASLPSGLFHGVPFLLKDLRALYAGVATTSGSRFFTDFTPDHDSELVARYKRSGLVIFGKTNTPEFGCCPSTEGALFGAARNPWNTAHSGRAAQAAVPRPPLRHVSFQPRTAPTAAVPFASRHPAAAYSVSSQAAVSIPPGRITAKPGTG